MNTKRVFSALLSSTLVLANSLIWAPQTQAYAFEPYQQTFIVTAYYSPLPGQQFYVTGSLAGDKRLNGNGTNGADGTPVYPGMIAAPKTYAFGTGVHCPGYIDGEIHDRGGAIVKAGVRSNAHDRLDFWAGHGDEALKTALYWGKRTLTCTVYPPGYRQTDQYVTLPNGPLNMTAKRFLKSPTTTTSTPTYTGISARNKQLFRDLGYDPDDKDQRIAFQLRHDIIDSAEDAVAGNVGPQTTAKLEAIAAEIGHKVPREGLSEDDVDPDVRVLQQQLVEMGYLNAEPTAIFGPQTKAALIQYQLEMELIDSSDHPAAGYLGPGTYKALKDRAIAQYSFSDQDQAQIALLKAEKLEDELIAKADLFAQKAPEEEVILEDPDYFKEALEELSKNWIEDHSPIDDNLQSKVSGSVVLASVVEEDTYEHVREMLTPVVHPFQSHLRMGVVHDDVRKVQAFLKKNGYLEIDQITNYFGIETKKAVRQFQIDQGIVDSIYSAGAGVVGPKTVRVLNALNYDQEFSLPKEITNVIRAPAVHPDDLRIKAPLQQASADQKKTL